jgi:hypothetical protein
LINLFRYIFNLHRVIDIVCQFPGAGSVNRSALNATVAAVRDSPSHRFFRADMHLFAGLLTYLYLSCDLNVHDVSLEDALRVCMC